MTIFTKTTDVKWYCANQKELHDKDVIANEDYNIQVHVLPQFEEAILRRGKEGNTQKQEREREKEKCDALFPYVRVCKMKTTLYYKTRWRGRG